jgi:hypothetical protein
MNQKSPFEQWRENHLYQIAVSPEILKLIAEAFQGGRMYEMKPKQEQGEPVAWMNAAGTDAVFRDVETSLPNWSDYYYIPLYTAPPQRTWVGLTDEEMQAVVDAQPLVSNINVYFKAIEAKLREKNNG